jgi:hypothetical protein
MIPVAAAESLAVLARPSVQIDPLTIIGIR